MQAAEAQAMFGPSAVLDTRLVEIFRTMEAAGIRYCMLRGYELVWQAGSKEIDVLVLPEHMPALRNLLRERGFVTIPAWGHAPHHFFISYDPATDTWLKLDVVDAVRYGERVRALEVDLAYEILRKRERYPYTFLPAPEEECIKLLLHCVLHKRQFTPDKSDRLLRLLGQIRSLPTASRSLAADINGTLAPAITIEMLNRVVDTGDCQPLLDRRSAIVKRLFWASPFKSSWRWLTGTLCRAIRPLCVAVLRRGVTVALLAPDGAGKSTLAQHLANDPFISAQIIYMGTNCDSQDKRLRIAEWLRRTFPGHFGRTPQSEKRWYSVRFLNYALLLAEHWYRIVCGFYHKLRGRFVVFDRYMYDAWLTPLDSSRKPLRHRLFDVPWPHPDMVIILDAPGQVLYDRKQEHSPEWLESRRREYLQLRERLPNAIYVDAARPASEVHGEVISLMWKKYGERERR